MDERCQTLRANQSLLDQWDRCQDCGHVVACHCSEAICDICALERKARAQ